jgi:hypothetical protein
MQHLQGHISSDRGGAIAYVKFQEPEGAAAGLAANMMEVGGGNGGRQYCMGGPS